MTKRVIDKNEILLKLDDDILNEIDEVIKTCKKYGVTLDRHSVVVLALYFTEKQIKSQVKDFFEIPHYYNSGVTTSGVIGTTTLSNQFTGGGF